MDSAWGERCVSGDRVSLNRPTVFRFQSEDVAVCDQSVGSRSSRHATTRARPMNPEGPRCRSHKLLEANADAKSNRLLRLTPDDGDHLTVGEIEAVTQLEVMTFVNHALPLTLTSKQCVESC